MGKVGLVYFNSISQIKEKCNRKMYYIYYIGRNFSLNRDVAGIGEREIGTF